MGRVATRTPSARGVGVNVPERPAGCKLSPRQEAGRRRPSMTLLHVSPLPPSESNQAAGGGRCSAGLSSAAPTGPARTSQRPARGRSPGGGQRRAVPVQEPQAAQQDAHWVAAGATACRGLGGRPCPPLLGTRCSKSSSRPQPRSCDFSCLGHSLWPLPSSPFSHSGPLPLLRTSPSVTPQSNPCL